MAKPRVIYWFRTDLRLHDSPALKAALYLNAEAFWPVWTVSICSPSVNLRIIKSWSCRVRMSLGSRAIYEGIILIFRSGILIMYIELKLELIDGNSCKAQALKYHNHLPNTQET